MGEIFMTFSNKISKMLNACFTMKEDANGKYLRDPKSTKNLKNLVLYQYFKRDGISLLCVG